MPAPTPIEAHVEGRIAGVSLMPSEARGQSLCVGFKQSPAFRVASPHLLASSPSPATPAYDRSALGYDQREQYPSHSLSSLLGTSSNPLTSPRQTWTDPPSCFYQRPTDPSDLSHEQRVMGLGQPGPAQMQAHAAYEAALSALAQPPPAHTLTQQQPGGNPRIIPSPSKLPLQALVLHVSSPFHGIAAGRRIPKCMNKVQRAMAQT